MVKQVINKLLGEGPVLFLNKIILTIMYGPKVTFFYDENKFWYTLSLSLKFVE